MFNSFAELASAAASQLSLDNLNLDKLQDNGNSKKEVSTAETITESSFSTFTGLFNPISVVPAPTKIINEDQQNDIENLKHDLDIANQLNKTQADRLKFLEDSYQQLSISYEIKLKKSNDEIQNLNQQLLNQSKSFEEKLKSISNTNVETSESSNSTTLPSFQELEILKERYELLEKSLQSTTHDFERRESDLKDIIYNKEETIKQVSANSDKVLQDLSQSISSYTELKQKFTNLRKEMKKLKSTSEEQGNTISNQQKNISSLESEVNERNNIIKELDENIKRMINERETESIHYKEQVATMQSSISERDGKILEQTEQLRTLTKKLRELMQKYSDMRTQFQALNEDRKKTIELNESTSVKEEELTHLKQKLDASTRSLEEEGRRLVDLTDKYSECQREITRLHNANATLERENARLATDAQRAARLEAELQELRDVQTREREAMEHLAEYKKRAQAALREASGQAAELRDALAAAAAAHEQQERATQALAIAREENKELESKIELLENQIDSLRNELQSQLIQIQTSVSNSHESHPDTISSNNTSINRQPDPPKVESSEEDKRSTAVSEKIIPKNEESETIVVTSMKNEKNVDVISPEVTIDIKRETTPRRVPMPAANHPPGTEDADPSQLYLVNELYVQIDELRRQTSEAAQERIALEEQLQRERELSRGLSARVDELLAFLERARKLCDDPDSPVNVEYLKTCVYRFMTCTDPRDRHRLGHVISTVLKLTAAECAEVEQVLVREEKKSRLGVDEGLTNIASFAATSLESLFGTPKKSNQG